MKKILLFLPLCFGIIGLTSCKSTQARAEELVETLIKSSLYLPDTYESVSTQVDTAYYNPCFDQQVLNYAKTIVDAEKVIERSTVDMKRAKSTMALWGSYSAYARQQTSDAREQYNEAKASLDKATADKESAYQSMLDYLGSAPWGTILGWQITHRYRAETQNGMKSIGDALVVVDSDFSNVLFAMSDADTDISSYVEKVVEIINQEEEE